MLSAGLCENHCILIFLNILTLRNKKFLREGIVFPKFCFQQQALQWKFCALSVFFWAQKTINLCARLENQFLSLLNRAYQIASRSKLDSYQTSTSQMPRMKFEVSYFDIVLYWFVNILTEDIETIILILNFDIKAKSRKNWHLHKLLYFWNQ